MGQSALVTGAGGFIGHHLVRYLVDRGYHVRGADIKRPEYAPTAGHEFELLDLHKEKESRRLPAIRQCINYRFDRWRGTVELKLIATTRLPAFRSPLLRNDIE